MFVSTYFDFFTFLKTTVTLLQIIFSNKTQVPAIIVSRVNAPYLFKQTEKLL